MSKKRHLILNHWDIKAIINNTIKTVLSTGKIYSFVLTVIIVR